MKLTATPAPLSVYDWTRPPAALRAAALDGDLTAMRAVADWFRDRGQPPDPSDPVQLPGDEERARNVEAWIADCELQNLRAQQLRHRLAVHFATFTPLEPIELNTHTVKRFVSGCGLLVNEVARENIVVRAVNGVLQRATAGDLGQAGVRRSRATYCLGLPTDGEAEAETREQLLGLLAKVFPTAVFVIDFVRCSESEAGDLGLSELEG